MTFSRPFSPQLRLFSSQLWLGSIAFVFFFATSVAQAKKPDPVPPQFDANDNPTYYYTLGGDTPLYYEGKGEDAKPVYGWMDFNTYKGWRAYHSDCHVCHGPDGMGSSYAPALLESLDYLTWDEYYDVVINGRTEAQGAQKGNVMPAFGTNPNVANHIEEIYRYLKMRHDGKVRRGTRLPKLGKYVDPDEK